jgi:hypothetical protein
VAAVTEDEFNDALRSDVAELAGLFYRVRVPDSGASPELRVMAAIAAGLLDYLPPGYGGRLLRLLGEAACDDGG